LEMLVQSQDGEITLLPALPDAWASGEVRGVCARGGFVLNLSWANGKLIKTEISTTRGGSTRIVYGNKSVEVTLGQNSKKMLTW